MCFVVVPSVGQSGKEFCARYQVVNIKISTHVVNVQGEISMKRTIKSLLVASLLVSGVAQASTSNNHTFLNPRSVGVDLARQQTAWHRQLHKAKQNSDYGARFQATGFYLDSTNGSGAGRYFGFDGKKTFRVAAGSTPNVDIDRRHFIHDWNNATGALDATFSLDMERWATGGELSYYQNLDGLYEGLYFLINLPIVHVSHKAKLNVDEGETKQQITKDGNAVNVGVADYFNGGVKQDAGANQQAVLEKAKIDNKTHSETAVADLDFIFGYDFYRTEDAHFGINVGLSFPTANDADGVFLFEPYCGNPNWGLGLGVTGAFTPWSSDDYQSLELWLAANFRYLFEASETRVVGLKTQKWGHYMLMGEIGQLGVFPAANILARRVDVEPGSQIDALIALSYHYNGFTYDLGYNLFARESESVRIKGFDETKFGLAGNDYNATGAFAASDIATGAHIIGNTAARTTAATTATLKTSNLDHTRAETPGFATHKIFGAISHVWEKWDYPFMIKLGYYYEFAPSRKALENWSIFGGFGINV